MPLSKKISSVKSSKALAPKSKKHAAPPPPPPPHEEHREKTGKPGKKHPKKHEGKPGGKHLRRAYEHLGRVEALQGIASVDSVSTLVGLAQASIDHGDARPAADLLRAAEHLSFAAAAASSKTSPSLSPDLEVAIRREFRKLLEAAEEHDLSKDATLGKLLRQTLDVARSSFDTGNFRQALELARAAEALASIDSHDADMLETRVAPRALKP